MRRYWQLGRLLAMSCLSCSSRASAASRSLAMVSGSKLNSGTSMLKLLANSLCPPKSFTNESRSLSHEDEIELDVEVSFSIASKDCLAS